MRISIDFESECYKILKALSEIWGSPILPLSTKVVVSSRMKRSLGICKVTKAELVISSEMIHEENNELLYEIVVHEAAHLVVYLRYGLSAKPHGAEWKSLVSLAGMIPRSVIKAEKIHTPDHQKQEEYRYEHRCPVCQTIRVTKRPIASLRCRRCVQSGLDGKMIINRKTIAKDDKNGNA